MSAQATSKIEAVELSRVFAAPREQVFRAWTNAEALSRWFGPTAEHRTVVAELDVRAGGKYKLEIHRDNIVNEVHGVYREVKTPEKLVFTWAPSWSNFAESLVTVTFKDLGGSTEVALTHEGLTDEASRDAHRQGWIGGFENLSKSL